MSGDGEEQQRLIDCIDCGTTVDPDLEPCFAITDEIALCHACSARRGGAWDADRSTWAIAPKLTGLSEERMPAP